MSAMLSVREAAALLAGARCHGDAAATFSRVSTDSRDVGPDCLFVALKGERFDAHDFLDQVAANGAAAAIVSRGDGPWPLPVVRVPDTRLALAELARGWRQRVAIPLVAVVGSNGKTTVKDMIASIFAAHVGADQRLATRGNLNNDIGLPLTLLRLTPAHRLAVVELGMNHPGETAVLAKIAQPTIAVVNNAQREHQEFMATVEAVALEHASVIHALPNGGTAVYPADDPYEPIWRVAATDRVILDFALDGKATVSGVQADDGLLHVTTPAGAFDVRLPLLGAHNARNALAATAAALAAGVPLQTIGRGLEACEPPRGRLQAKVARVSGATVIDDTYNANPDSMRAALDVLAARPARRVIVMGDMGEVGDEGPAFHREIGAYARELRIDALLALGAASRYACEAFGDGARHFESLDALLAQLQQAGLDAHATVLVKGSRFMRMERVVDALVASTSSATAGEH